MRSIVCVLIALTTVATAVESASAEDGCGRGRYYNGYRCAPIDSQDYYGPPGYGGRPPPGDYYPRGPRGGYGPPPEYNKDCYTVRGRRICCPKRWTVQDGVCKPYTGR